MTSLRDKSQHKKISKKKVSYEFIIFIETDVIIIKQTKKQGTVCSSNKKILISIKDTLAVKIFDFSLFFCNLVIIY